MSAASNGEDEKEALRALLASTNDTEYMSALARQSISTVEDLRLMQLADYGALGIPIGVRNRIIHSLDAVGKGPEQVTRGPACSLPPAPLRSLPRAPPLPPTSSTTISQRLSACAGGSQSPDLWATPTDSC